MIYRDDISILSLNQSIKKFNQKCQSNDLDISNENYELSFKDPFTLTKITIPAR